MKGAGNRGIALYCNEAKELKRTGKINEQKRKGLKRQRSWLWPGYHSMLSPQPPTHPFSLLRLGRPGWETGRWTGVVLPDFGEDCYKRRYCLLYGLGGFDKYFICLLKVACKFWLGFIRRHQFDRVLFLGPESSLPYLSIYQKSAHSTMFSIALTKALILAGE